MEAAPLFSHRGSSNESVDNRDSMIDLQDRYSLSEVNPQSNHANDFNEFASVLEELRALDESLGVLFKDSPKSECMESYVIMQFRGKVARRLTRYSLLLKKGWALSELLLHDVVREQAKADYERHLAKLQEYKSKLSIWWSRTERSFHTMRLASLVSEMEMKKHSTNRMRNEENHGVAEQMREIKGTNEPEQSDVLLGLVETKSMMKNELGRMDAATQHLEESSKTIEVADQVYNEYGLRLASASALLARLKKRAEADSLYIWYSFLIFMFVCVFVVIKRLGILRFAISMFGIASCGATWVLDFLCGYLFELFGISKNPNNVALLNINEHGASSPAVL